MRLDWEPATDDATPSSAITYQVFVSDSPDSQNFDLPVVTTGPGATSAILSSTDTPLIAVGQRAYFAVRALDADGRVDANEVELAVIPVDPSFVAFVTYTGANGAALGDPATPFATIQAAIDAVEAAGGGVVLVDAAAGGSVYAEEVTIDGAGADGVGVFGGFPFFANLAPGADGREILATRNLATNVPRIAEPGGLADGDLVKVENRFVPTMIDGFHFENTAVVIRGDDVDLQVSCCSFKEIIVGVDTIATSGQGSNRVRIVGNNVEDVTDAFRLAGPTFRAWIQNNDVDLADEAITSGSPDFVVPPEGCRVSITHNLVTESGEGFRLEFEPADPANGGALSVQIERNELRSLDDDEAIDITDLADVGAGGSATLHVAHNLMVGSSYNMMFVEVLDGVTHAGVDVTIDVEDNTFLNGDEICCEIELGVAAGRTTTLNLRDNLMANFEDDVVEIDDTGPSGPDLSDGGRIVLHMNGNIVPGGTESVYVELGVAHGGRTDIEIIDNAFLSIYDYPIELFFGDHTGNSTVQRDFPDGTTFLTVWNNLITGGYDDSMFEDCRDGNGSAAFCYYGNNVAGFSQDVSCATGFLLEDMDEEGVVLMERNFLGIGGQDDESGLYLDDNDSIASIVRILNNVFPMSHGPGITCDSSGGQPQIVNNTVAYNGEYDTYGIEDGPQAFIHNCILSHNALADLDDEMKCSYTLLRDPEEQIGFGNIVGEPRYLFGPDSIFDENGGIAVPPDVFSLAPASPGLDAGDPDPMYNDPDGSRNDMGAYGGPGAGPIGLLDAGTPVPLVFLGTYPRVDLFTGATLIENGDTLTLAFTRAVDAATISAGISITNGGADVPGTFTTAQDGNHVVFTPATVLAGSDPFVEIRLNTALLDANGQALRYPVTHRFATAPAAVAEVEPNDSVAQAQSLGIGPGAGVARLTGSITAGNDDLFAFQGAAGDRIMATLVHRRSGGTGTLNIEVLNGAGDVVAEGETSAFSSDAYVDFVLPAGGEYCLRVTHAGGGTLDYELQAVLD